MINEGVDAVRSASSKYDDGDLNGAHEDVLRARARLTHAARVSPAGTQAKISTALGILDGLSGGITRDTKQIPTADTLMPQLPEDMQQALITLAYTMIQQLNPVSGLSGPAANVQQWMDSHDIKTQQDMQNWVLKNMPSSGPGSPSIP